MTRPVKACIYCHSKKIKCRRASENETCLKCLQQKQECCNRSSQKVTIVSVDKMRQQEEEIERLKSKIIDLERLHDTSGDFLSDSSSTNLQRDSNAFGASLFESFTALACIECSTSSVKFCNYLHDCLDGHIKKLENSHARFEDFNRLSPGNDIMLPPKHEALTLLQVAYQTICNDYYLLVISDTLTFMERVYDSVDLVGILRMELARLFFLFALGEFYFYPFKNQQGGCPGIKYFKTGLSLLDDTYEIPSLAQIEVLLLASIFFNSISHLKHAYVYIGICTRLATIMGLSNLNNQSQSGERGNRIMCTIYTLEVSLCSSLECADETLLYNIRFHERSAFGGNLRYKETGGFGKDQ